MPAGKGASSWVIYAFDTPWSPPKPLFEQVVRVWPTLTFLLEYEEPANGIAGTMKAQGRQLAARQIEHEKEALK